MRIIYGVTGEGLGHSSRSQEMILHLQKQGHEVLSVCYGLACPVIEKICDTIEVEGVRLKYGKKGLSVVKTLRQNTPFIFSNLKHSRQIAAAVKKFKPDIAITDYEPVTALIAYKFGLPLISIDNQHSLTHTKVSVPRKYYKDYLLAKAATIMNPPRADAYIILSFAKLKPTRKNAYITAPILRRAIIDKKPTKTGDILVYINQPDDKLLEILADMPEKFIVYGYERNLKAGNVTYKKKGDWFVDDLANCRAVIATAGFSLLSEALYWDKPFFALPLKGQFEQVVNAIFLKRAEFGDFAEAPDKERINRFLRNLGGYEKNLKRYKINPDEAFGHG
jgi:uncharacterized protein (TIGR00661 family)